jgi:hypothetical protein
MQQTQIVDRERTIDRDDAPNLWTERDWRAYIAYSYGAVG